jgi:hypothetical protein
MHHSANYRSVMLLGQARIVESEQEKLLALEAIVEHIVPGRSAEARPPNENELKATTVLALPIDEASAKIRSGPPQDDEEDHALPIWAGVIPLVTEARAPQPDPLLDATIAVPPSATDYRRPASPRT